MHMWMCTCTHTQTHTTKQCIIKIQYPKHVGKDIWMDKMINEMEKTLVMGPNTYENWLSKYDGVSNHWQKGWII